MRTLLITSVGSLVGHNILESLEPRRHEWRVVGVNSQPLAANNFRCDAAYLVPEALQEKTFLSSLREILRNEQPEVVLTGRDLDLSPLALLKEEREFAKILFLSPAAACVPVVNDKYASWLFALQHGLPFARTAYNRAELDALIAEVGFPIIGKRRFGNASRGVFIIREKREAEAGMVDGNFIFQEFLNAPHDLKAIIPDFRFGVPISYGMVENDHYSAQGLIGHEGDLFGFFAGLHILEGGKSISVQRLNEPALEQLTLQYTCALGPLGYIGPVNLNCKKIGPNRFIPYELNGRFTGGSAARAALGFPEVIYALDYFLDNWRPKEGREFQPEDVVLRRIVQKTPHTQLIDLDSAECLMISGVWRRES
jgi:hypothetical protein